MDASISPRERRCERRRDMPSLRASVRRAGLWRHRLQPCTVLDIDHGGMGISGRDIRLQMGEKVHLHIQDGGGAGYQVTGVVSYCQVGESRLQYGIVFIHVPPELDEEIERLLHPQEAPSRESTRAGRPGLRLVEGTRRQAQPRVRLPALALQVRRPLRATASDATLINIGPGGLAFHMSTAPLPLGGRLELVLKQGGLHLVLAGRITYVRPGEGGHRYGVAFAGRPPPELLRLMNMPA